MCLWLVVRLGIEAGSALGTLTGVAVGLEFSVRLRDLSCFSGPTISSADVYGVGAVGMDDDDSVRFSSAAFAYNG